LTRCCKLGVAAEVKVKVKSGALPVSISVGMLVDAPSLRHFPV
jgi:hypothetical protein